MLDELPYCETYSKYISTKNLDFKSGKSVRKNPDPIKEFVVYKERPYLPPRNSSVVELFKHTPAVQQRGFQRSFPSPGSSPIKMNPVSTDDWTLTLLSPQKEQRESPTTKYKSSVSV